MTDLAISSTLAPDMAAAWARDKLLFHGEAWTALLESSFNARTQYIWDDTTACGGAVTSFPAGPFRLGFLGFPIGGLVGGDAPDAALIDRWQAQRSELLPVAVRIPVSGFVRAEPLAYPYESTPETAIVDLPSWTLAETSGNHRRDVNKALRSELEVVDARHEDQGDELFGIYADTLKRHSGGLRYNAAYFRGLVSLARANSQVRVMLAQRQGDTAGFVVVARHGSTAFYLHGGIVLQYRREQPSALLLHEAIQWARDIGCESFNLMSSPAGQQSLVWYKEKWGAETREHRTYSMPLKATYRLFQLAERIYRFVR